MCVADGEDGNGPGDKRTCGKGLPQLGRQARKAGNQPD